MNARVIPAGDAALVVEFDEVIDPVVNARVMAVARAIRGARVSGVRDVVPTYRSIAVYFDPLRTDSRQLREMLERAAAADADGEGAAPRAVRVPVCYGDDFGPDLESVAEHAALSADEVVRLHSAGAYRVFMLGFVPGFAYLGTLDPRIHAPRLETPRVRVPAGSIGIAGGQTGVYPMETPGGWRLIGRTPLKPFDHSRPDSFLFKPGGTVQFYPIDRRRFDAWPTAGAAN